MAISRGMPPARGCHQHRGRYACKARKKRLIPLRMVEYYYIASTPEQIMNLPGTKVACLVLPSLLPITRTPLSNLTATCPCSLADRSCGCDAPCSAGLRSVQDWHLKALLLSAQTSRGMDRGISDLVTHITQQSLSDVSS